MPEFLSSSAYAQGITGDRLGSDTLSVESFEFRELCFEITAEDELQYDFQSDQPVDFNIHYHDGLTIHFPAKLTGVTHHAGQFVSEKDQPYCLTCLNQGLAKTSIKCRVIGP